MINYDRHSLENKLKRYSPERLQKLYQELLALQPDAGAPADGGNLQLAAFIKTRGAVNLELRALQAYLDSRLPGYMIPVHLQTVNEYPKTPNGKVDRQRLAATPVTAQSNDRQPPQNALEQVLHQLWSEALGVEAIDRNADFFQLGGHSLLVTAVVSQIRDNFEIKLPLSSLFEAPTIAELAAYMENMPGEKERIIRTAELLQQLQGLSEAEVDELLQQRGISMDGDV